MLHSMVEVSGPRALQSSPPLAGGGLVHVLFLVFTPPPQLFEHSPYGPQSEYPPFTVKKRDKKKQIGSRRTIWSMDYLYIISKSIVAHFFLPRAFAKANVC